MTGGSAGVADLCDQGRCAQILRHIAEQKLVEKVADRNSQVMAAILTGVLTDLGVDASEQRVRQVVADRIRRVIDNPEEML